MWQTILPLACNPKDLCVFLISFLSQVKTLELVLFFYSHKWAQKKYKKTTNPNIDKRIGIWISKLKSVKVGLGLWPDYTIVMLRTMDTKGSYCRIDKDTFKSWIKILVEEFLTRRTKSSGSSQMYTVQERRIWIHLPDVC